jgi:ParB/RepB/Spo0J family partition protein
MMLTLNIDSINVESNVRNEVGDVTSLASSIDRLGLIQPIIVTHDPDEGYILVAGARRLAAVRELGWSEIEAIENEIVVNTKDLIASQYAENHERVDLTDWETAQVAWDLKLEGLKQGEVAAIMGVPTKDVSKLHKIVKALTKDEALDDALVSTFDFDGLLKLADTPIPEHSMDVILKLTNGDEFHVYGAVRSVEKELATIEFYEENADQLNEWSVNGVQITHSNPRHAWGKTTSYGLKDDPKVIDLGALGIKVKDHVSEGCHMVWLDEGFNSPEFKHYCMNKKNHADKGPSDVKAKDQKIVASNAPDPVARAERKAVTDAKNIRRAQAGVWMAGRYNKADMYQLALHSALSGDGWKEDHIRAATWMLGLNSERPTGADYGWYTNRLNKYLDEQFGDDPDNDKRREWKIRMTHARRYIDQFWPIDLVKEQIESMEVTDE